MHSIRRHSVRALFTAIGPAALLLGCSTDPGTQDDSSSLGAVSARLVSESPHDVTQVLYRVVAAAEDCNGTALAERTVPLEAETLPESLQTPGSSNTHHIADALFMLDPGEYRVCAVPMTEAGDPSADCGQAETVATVESGLTAEVLLISQCTGNQRGGLDAVVVLNDPPIVDDITISPSKFIETCEDATLTVAVSDPDGDELTDITWELLTPGPVLIGSGASAAFTAEAAGDYEVLVQVADVYGGVGSLIVPMHVQQGDDANCGVATVCDSGTDPGTESSWVVCAADENTAWVSANYAGYYHVDLICQNLGYSGASQYGGTCGNVCGWCENPTSCEAPGNRYFDGYGECGTDELGRYICYTVMWECTN
jgi:hypothetical protein